jgi:DNA modification methylase
MSDTKQIVISGNNIETLKNYPDNYFDSIVTDPPYGLGKEPNAEEMLRAWVDTGYLAVGGSGFMGKEWDSFVPQPIFWKEIFRVLKHGGHVVSFFGTRTYDWGCMAIRLGGFEIRDCIQWVYGCLSDDTEILTRSGYIQYHKFKNLPNFEQQEILIYDSKTDIYKWEKPERWNDYNIYKDTCYRIKSDNTDQIVSRNHRCVVEREGNLVFIEAENLSQMEYMPTLSDDFFELQNTKILQSPMQRILSGSRVEKMGENRFGNSEFTTQQNKKRKQGGEKSCLERGNNLSKKERLLFGSEIEICEMPNRFDFDVKKRWIYSGVSVNNGKAIRKDIIENGVRTSYRPRPNKQRYNQFNVIFNKQGTQTIRVGKTYSTTLATITPFEYTGVIFCPTVSTGCFVARRNGKIFITGNSGFPKSHNISKAINKMSGVEYDEIPASGVGFMKPDSEDWNVTKNQLIQKGESTEQAKQWEGWGSALKPAHEDLVLARKPFQFSSDFVYLYENIVYELKLQICQSKLFAKDVKEIFLLSQKESQKVELDFAQWSVGKPFNTKEDLLVLMDMLQLELNEGNTTLNIVLLWLNTLVELWNVVNTYTTKTESSTITELRILKSLEWESIFQNITHLKNNKTNGLIANVLTVESLFSVLNLKLNDILTHSAKEDATLKENEKTFVLNSEQIVLARKPLEKGLSIAQNVLKWGTGAINIDASRIGNELIKGQKAGQGFNNVKGFGVNTKLGNEEAKEYISEDINGRFPANFIMSHHPDCKCEYFKYNGEEEIVEDWNCVDDCPIKILDEQSGELKSGKMTANHNRTTNGSPNGIYGKFDVNHPLAETYGDKGGASRFFYVAKASQWERHYGLDNFEEKNSASSEFRPNHLEKSLNGESGNPYGRWKPLKNIHPTVKPIKLMQYLIRLVTPPNGIVLDPFAGSGTTGIACKIDGFEFVGLELSEEYTEIANSRIQSFNEELLLFDETIIYKNRGDEENDTDSQQLTLF